LTGTGLARTINALKDKEEPLAVRFSCQIANSPDFSLLFSQSLTRIDASV
jgi:hypothetical protein